MTSEQTQAKVARILEKSDITFTKIAGQSDTKMSEQSHFDVYELTLDKDDNPVKIVISGSQPFIALQASLLPAIQQLIRAELGRAELAQVVGYPYGDYVQQHIAPVSVQIHWRLSGSRPYEPVKLTKQLGEKTAPRPFLTIPNIHRSKCTWDNILAAAGGENGYTYGGHYAVALMGDKTTDAKIGKGGQMKAYASTKGAATELVERAAELSKSRILRLVHGEEVRSQKVRMRVFPAWFLIFNSKLAIHNRELNRQTDTGQKIPLGHRPTDVQAVIRKCLEKG
ncbi:hypothetical protein QUB36_13505 [Microcoleus sp. AT8-B1]|uniref:hypothetical protein n=1 Tax=unclassified Microcoleus TaxID=2642155 RepID=UPI002FD4CBC1